MSDIIEQYKKLHKEKHPKGYINGWFPGKSIKWHIDEIAELIKTYNPKSLLDFGCGQGMQYTDWKFHEQWGGLLPTLYDPAVERYENLPDGKFDGVISTDVMEHVPNEDLDLVLSQIFSRANKFVFLSIALFETGDLLPDGRDVHVTVETPDWWKARMHPFVPEGVDLHVAWRHKNRFESEHVK